jgi:hypothetical protein
MQKWAPQERSLEEKLNMVQKPPLPQPLGNEHTNRLFFQQNEVNGHDKDDIGDQLEMSGMNREPVETHFGNVGPKPDRIPVAPPALPLRAPRKVIDNIPENERVSTQPQATPAPKPVPPPMEDPKPIPPIPSTPTHNPWPQPPTPELMVKSPARPSCGKMCNPGDADPVLAKVLPPPMTDAALAHVGLEGTVIAKVQSKIKNREGWLRAQKSWLSKAVEAAATIKREIELAEMTRDMVASDLEQLKKAQDRLSIKLKADQLKWAFKDKKITMEFLQEEFEALENQKREIKVQMEDANHEIMVLEQTLGPPSEQIIINPKDLDDPLAFLDGLEPEENFGQFDD